MECIHCPQAFHQPQKSSVIFEAESSFALVSIRPGIGWRVRCLGFVGLLRRQRKAKAARR